MSPPLFHGHAFLEYFAAYLRNHPNAHVRIITYTFKNPEPGSVVHDILSSCNNRPSHISVGLTRYVSLRSIQREIKRAQKTFPKLSIRTVYNDHRKIYLTREIVGGTKAVNRAWVGSQNLNETHTQNLMYEVGAGDLAGVWDEWWNLQSELNSKVNPITYL